MACLSALIFITSPLEAKSVSDFHLIDTVDNEEVTDNLELTGRKVDDYHDCRDYPDCPYEIKDNGGVPSAQDTVDDEEVNEVKDTNENEYTVDNEEVNDIEDTNENEDTVDNEEVNEIEDTNENEDTVYLEKVKDTKETEDAVINAEGNEMGDTTDNKENNEIEET